MRDLLSASAEGVDVVAAVAVAWEAEQAFADAVGASDDAAAVAGDVAVVVAAGPALPSAG